MKEKIAIIGAGPAGLTAAYEILKNDTEKKYEVIIVEENSQVGGISKTINFGDKYLVDTGIHRFFSKSQKVNEIWNELLPLQSKPAYDDIYLKRKKQFPTTGSNPEEEDNSMLIKNRTTRILYNNKFFDYPVSLNIDTIKKLGLIKMIKIVLSYIKACLLKKKETSLENFYINRFGSELYKTFFKNYTEKVWGIEPSKISPDWGAQRVKGISIFEILKNILKKKTGTQKKNETQTSLIEEFIYPKLGAGQIWQTMANKIEEMGRKNNTK